MKEGKKTLFVKKKFKKIVMGHSKKALKKIERQFSVGRRKNYKKNSNWRCDIDLQIRIFQLSKIDHIHQI